MRDDKLLIMNLIKIRELCETKDGGVKRLAEEIGMSEQNLHRCITLNKIQAGELEKIANIFDVPIGYFFDKDAGNSNINIGHQVKGNGNKVSGDITLSECQKEIAHLKELLAEKERTIQILMNK